LAQFVNVTIKERVMKKNKWKLVMLFAALLPVGRGVSQASRGDGVSGGVGGSAWRIETVTSREGYFPSLALDIGNVPHIAYSASGWLYQAQRTGSPIGPWAYEPVDPVVVMRPSIQMDPGANPHISYGNSTPQGVFLKYARRSGSAWIVQTVDPQADVAQWTSMALDAGGNPHIAYGGSSGHLKYARWTGSSWSTQTVATGGAAYVSLKLDSQGRPHIAFQTGPQGALKYAVKGGTEWRLETVDAAGGWYTSLALDAANAPRIAYQDPSQNNLRYAEKFGQAWILQTVETNSGAQSVTGDYVSLALDAYGNPHLAYSWSVITYGYPSPTVQAALKYAKRAGAGWEFQTVSNTDRAHDISLALDPAGAAHISYRSYYIKYATNK
jgi:hypothetical protein